MPSPIFFYNMKFFRWIMDNLAGGDALLGWLVIALAAGCLVLGIYFFVESHRYARRRKAQRAIDTQRLLDAERAMKAGTDWTHEDRQREAAWDHRWINLTNASNPHQDA